MASKGKKGKGRGKGQTLNLNEFLGNEGASAAYRPPGSGATATVSVASNWADEMEEEGYEPPRSSTVVLPTAPRAALGPGIEDERIPHRPPFTAYIANLPYDVDESEIRDTFEKARLKIENVRLMKDEGGRLKGYGYADFADRDSLVDVLTMELSVKNRKMRIDLASQAGKDRPERNYDDQNRGGNRGRDDDPNAGRSDAGDWRSGPPPPSREDDRRDRYNGRDSYDRDRYNGRGSYDRDNRGGGRGFSNYEPARERDGGRYGGFSRGENRDGGYNRDDRREREAPKERPKLNLAPRSKPVEEEGGDGAQSSIFGGAKPVDTLKREKEMEERLQKEKEEKEKALEEAKKNKPSAASIFGSAKPVDTTQREKEVEEKLSKLSASDANKSEDNQSRAYKPPARRDDRGYDRRDDRGYDRRDDRGGYDRDRRTDNRGSYDRRNDDRGYDRRDDRGGYDRRNDRNSSDRDRDNRSVEKEDRRRTPEPPLKKYEEPKPVNVVAQNKFAFLQEEDVGGGSSEEN